MKRTRGSTGSAGLGCADADSDDRFIASRAGPFRHYPILPSRAGFLMVTGVKLAFRSISLLMLLLAMFAITRCMAFRRRALRDAFNQHFGRHVVRVLPTILFVAALFGITLFHFVLPRLPWFASHAEERMRIFLFAVQHLGDLIAGIIIVGQIGQAAGTELVQAREKKHAYSLTAMGIDPLEYLVLPRLWAIALLYVFMLFVFKFSATVFAVFFTFFVDGNYYGAEVFQVLSATGGKILTGYGINALLGLLVGAVCCAPFLVIQRGASGVVSAHLGTVFRNSMILIFAAKTLSLSW